MLKSFEFKEVFMVKKGSGSSKKKNISQKKGAEVKKVAENNLSKSKPIDDEKAINPAEKIKPSPDASSAKLSVKELILKKFDAPAPKTLFSVEPDRSYADRFTSPPFADDNADLRRLLALKFDIGTFPLVMPKKPATIRELLAKTFETRTPQPLFSVEPDRSYADRFTAPPFAADNAKLRQLLALKFDMSAFPLVMPRKPVTISELLAKTFEAWIPEKLFSVSCDDSYYKGIVPPPFVSGDETVCQRVKGLLALKFDINAFALVEPVPPQPVIPKPEPEPGYRPDVRRYDPGSQASVSYTPPPSIVKKEAEKGSEPMEKTMKYFIAALAAIFTLIIVASFSNVSNYYLEPKGHTLEVWKGIFAPLGKKLLVRMPGVQRPADLKAVYTKEEVYPVMFNYFIKKADSLMEGEGMPDFMEIRSDLNTAMSYGLTDEHRRLAQSRLTGIDLVVLLYKADVATGKNDMKAAMGYLDKASKLKLEPHQTDLVRQRTEMTKSLMEKGSAKPQPVPAVPAVPAEKSPAPAAPAKQDLQSTIQNVLEGK